MRGDVMCRDGVDRLYNQLGEPAVAQGQPGLELIPPIEITRTKCVLVHHRAELSRVSFIAAVAERKRAQRNPRPAHAGTEPPVAARRRFKTEGNAASRPGLTPIAIDITIELVY
jgi:hypothetical protein